MDGKHESSPLPSFAENHFNRLLHCSNLNYYFLFLRFFKITNTKSRPRYRQVVSVNRVRLVVIITWLVSFTAGLTSLWSKGAFTILQIIGVLLALLRLPSATHGFISFFTSEANSGSKDNWVGIIRI